MTGITSMGQLLTSVDAWAALVSLSALEIVLGIDNVIFISILVSRLDPQRGRKARRLGMLLAVIFRIALLFTLTSLLGLSATVFTLRGNPFSWRDFILIAGGLFLIAKATRELHAQAASEEAASEEAAASEDAEGRDSAPAPPARDSMLLIAGQIVVIDLVFSVDSIVTAIGMAQDIRIMMAAVLIAVAVMYAASGAVAGFVAAWPTTKTLALAFLMLIGVALVADGFDFHIPRGYVYFAMAFAAAVETFNVLTARRRYRRYRTSGPDIAAGPLPAPPPQSADQVQDGEGEG
jgi:predicted tellurium resistance membrane protein TerC